MVRSTPGEGGSTGIVEDGSFVKGINGQWLVHMM